MSPVGNVTAAAAAAPVRLGSLVPAWLTLAAVIVVAFIPLFMLLG